MSKVLLSGATGFIGSHVWAELRSAGFDVCGFDNFSNSDPSVLDSLEELLGEKPTFEEVDLLDEGAVSRLLRRHRPDAVIHFAALKSVSDSMADPLKYYRNNVCGLINLLGAMEESGCRTMVFSSSATVYGCGAAMPLHEGCPTAPANPYGFTKLVGEQLLQGLSAQGWSIASLRYFNPVGAHPSGLIGEIPRGTPANLMPYVAQVAAGERQKVSVFGDDYPTRDGTGVRDYIHVVDLAQGHVRALERLLDHAGSFTVNLGTGAGYTVLEVIRAYERASGRVIPYEVAPRRDGDVAECYADPSRAHALLGWKAELSLDDMCRDSWNFQRRAKVSRG